MHSLGARATALHAGCLPSCRSGGRKLRIGYAHCACQRALSLTACVASPPACRWRIAAAQAAANVASDTPIAQVSLHAGTLNGGAGGSNAAGVLLTDSGCAGSSRQRFEHARCARRRARSLVCVHQRCNVLLTGAPLTDSCRPGVSEQRFDRSRCACQRARTLATRAASPARAAHG